MIGAVIGGSGEFSVITCGPQPEPRSNVIRPLPWAFAFAMAERNEPLPLSLVLLTTL